MGEDTQGLEDILRRMTITLGDPALQYVLASEGNTSVKTADGKRMIIKAGGTAFLNPNFVAVEVKEALRLMSQGYNAAEVSKKMREMVIDHRGQKPSKEVTFHAALREYKWIVHTHAREIGGFLCSKAADHARKRAQYIKKMEEISGGSIAWAPYANPGISLAKVIRKSFDRYTRDHEYRPEAVFLQNHGCIVGGDEPRVVEQLTGKYAVAVATLRSELSSRTSAREKKFGGMKDNDYSKHGEKLSKAVLEKLKERGYQNIGYYDSELLRLFVRSRRGKEYALAGSIAPEQIQYLGVRPAWVDYKEYVHDFVKGVETALVDYMRKFDSEPKILYAEGLGMFAIGNSDKEVRIICDVAEKSVDVLMRTIPFGGPRYLTEEQESFLVKRSRS